MTLIEAKPLFMDWATKIFGVWFPPTTVGNKLMSSVSKVVLENNWNKYESTVSQLFTDKDGNLTIDTLIDQLINDFVPVEGLKVNDFFGDNMITRNVSTKILERKDLYQLRNLLRNGTLQQTN